jgi:hypothetical protein
VFFVLHRHRFGQFVRAVLDEAADESRLRLLDDRGQILELRGTLAGYRGQLPRATIWILRIAGVDDHLDRVDLGAPVSARTLPMPTNSSRGSVDGVRRRSE